MKRLVIYIMLSLLIAVECQADPVTIRILHFNDFHGFANPTNNDSGNPPLGGAVALYGEIKKLRRQYPSLLLAAGDMIQGDNWARLSEGKNVIELMNLLAVDAMSLGNHEFDFGQIVLKQRISEASFPVLAANVDGIPNIMQRAYFNRNGVRIAVIGLVTEDTPQSSHPRNMSGLTFKRPLDVARQEISQAKHNNDLVILLTHQGYEHDRAMAEALCGGREASPLPILIVGGHTHTRLQQPTIIANCSVVQAWEHGKALGIVDLTLDGRQLLDVKGRLIEIKARPHGNHRVEKLVEHYNRDAAALMAKQAGSSRVELVQRGSRLRETNLGNLVSDIVRKTTGAQIAIVNGGSLRTDIPKGKINVRQIYSALPFNSYLVAVKMDGRQLLAALEHGVSGIENGEGRFPQVSGLRFSFNPAKPVGQRIISAEVGGAPVKVDQEYTVATLDFIAAGGDGYKSFGEAIRSSGDFSEVAGAMKSSRLVYNDPGHFLRDIVLDELIRLKVVSPAVECRITEVH